MGLGSHETKLTLETWDLCFYEDQVKRISKNHETEFVLIKDVWNWEDNYLYFLLLREAGDTA